MFVDIIICLILIEHWWTIYLHDKNMKLPVIKLVFLSGSRDLRENLDKHCLRLPLQFLFIKLNCHFVTTFEVLATLTLILVCLRPRF